MTKKINVEFDQAKKAISLSEKWFDLSGGLYAAKVEKENTKIFFKSSKAAGRDFVMVDTAGRVITLTDTLNGLDSFQAVDAATVKKAAGLVDEVETEPAAKTETISTVKIDNAVKLAIEAYSQWTKKPENGRLVGVNIDGEYFHFEDEKDVSAAAAKGFDHIAISIEEAGELLDLTPATIDNIEELHNQVEAFHILVEAETALKENKPLMKEFRPIAKELNFFDIDKAARLFHKALNGISDTSEIKRQGNIFTKRNKETLAPMETKEVKAAYMLALLPGEIAELLGRQVVTFEAYTAQYNRLYDNLSYAEKYESSAAKAYDSKQKKSIGYKAAARAFQRENGDLMVSDREVAAYELAFTYGEKTPAPVAATKETGFVAVTLDHKFLTKAPAAAKSKRPKSKSRARLDASRAAIKTLDKTTAEFKSFCKKINAGREIPYSERNCALLFNQSNGRATQVKGFKAWKAAGRVVKKGSKALVIEAPKMIKTTDKNGEQKEHLICTPVCVFDVSQIEVLGKKEA